MEIVYSIDVDILVELERRCFPLSAYTRVQLLEMLEDKQRYKVLGVRKNEVIASYIIVFDNSEELEIMKIGTLPEYRRDGFGTILLKEIEKLKKKILLEVRESNQGAREFYKKFGFIEIGKRKNYYSDTRESAIIMQK